MKHAATERRFVMILALAWAALGAAITGTSDADQGPAVVARQDGQAAEPFIAKGLLLYRKLRFQEARKELERAVEADPYSARAHFYLGYTLYKIAEPTRRLTAEKVQAREEFARSFALDRSFRPVW
jgi:tetratricopeptide (TPR) repeat protein